MLLIDSPRVASKQDEQSARSELRRQISRLEDRLSSLTCQAFPEVLELEPLPSRGARLLDLGGLEVVRDHLAYQVRRAERQLQALEINQQAARLELQQMLLDPKAFRGRRISLRELGEPGCGAYRSVPRLGIIGRMMGWWQIKLSSGCP